MVGRDDVLVAKGYRLLDRDQQFLMPESMRDWLPASDPVWLVISVVAGLDTSGLHARRRTGGAGRAGYDPDMLLTLLIWAWAQGVRSSRVIERLCQPRCGVSDHLRWRCARSCDDLAVSRRGRRGLRGVVRAGVDVVCAAGDGPAGGGGHRFGQARVGCVVERPTAPRRAASSRRRRTGPHRCAEGARCGCCGSGRACGHRCRRGRLYGPGRRGDEVPDDFVDPRSRAARIDQALAELKAQVLRR